SATGIISSYQELQRSRLSPPTSKMAIRRGSNANRMRMKPPRGRSSFMFAWDYNPLLIEGKHYERTEEVGPSCDSVGSSGARRPGAPNSPPELWDQVCACLPIGRAGLMATRRLHAVASTATLGSLSNRGASRG